MTFARDTLFLYDWHFSTAILKAIRNSKKSTDRTQTLPRKSVFLNTFELVVTLTFDLRIWLLYTTHRLYVVNTCAKLFGDQVIGGKVMARTWKRHWRTDGRMDGQTNKNYMSPIAFVGAIKGCAIIAKRNIVTRLNRQCKQTSNFSIHLPYLTKFRLLYRVASSSNYNCKYLLFTIYKR